MYVCSSLLQESVRAVALTLTLCPTSCLQIMFDTFNVPAMYVAIQVRTPQCSWEYAGVDRHAVLQP